MTLTDTRRAGEPEAGAGPLDVEATLRRQQRLCQSLQGLVEDLRADHETLVWEMGAMRELLGATGALPLAKFMARSVARRAAVGLRKAVDAPHVARRIARCLGPTSAGRLAAVTSGLSAVAGIGLPRGPSGHSAGLSGASGVSGLLLAPRRSALRSGSSFPGASGLQVRFNATPVIVYIASETSSARSSPRPEPADVERPAVEVWQPGILVQQPEPQTGSSNDDDIPPLEEEEDVVLEQAEADEDESAGAPQVAFPSLHGLHQVGQFRDRRLMFDPRSDGDARPARRGAASDESDVFSAGSGSSRDAFSPEIRTDARGRLLIPAPHAQRHATTSKHSSPPVRPRFGSPSRSPLAARSPIPEVD